jgi:hypothetical protein
MNTVYLVALFTAMVVAATPLVFAALGELVAERAGVLNLGVEGMMLTGALTAFAVSTSTGSMTLGFFAAALAVKLSASRDYSSNYAAGTIAPREPKKVGRRFPLFCSKLRVSRCTRTRSGTPPA